MFGAPCWPSSERSLEWLGSVCSGSRSGPSVLFLGSRAASTYPPEGNLWETATFNGAVGVFHLTQATLAPEADFTERGQRRWGTALIIATLYCVRNRDCPSVPWFGSTVLSGGRSSRSDPRRRLLSRRRLHHGTVSRARLAVPESRDYPAPAGRPICGRRLLGVFGVGIWMSIFQGRTIGVEGNLLPIHAAGFHGLQAIPLVALLLVWSGAQEIVSKRWVHVAGIAWAGFCGALLWQAGTGGSPLAVSPATVATLFFFGGWAVVALVAVRAWVHRRQPEATRGVG